MISKRLLIFIEGGVVQALLSPDREKDFDIIIKDVDRIQEGENPCFFMPVDSGLTEEEWQEYVDAANEEEDEEDDS